MNDMKCPFCGQELIKRHAATTDYNSMFITYYCGNPECESTTDLIGCKEFWDILGQLIRTRKENEDKQAVLNCVVDMLKTLNQKYTLIMGKDVIKETVRLLEQTKGGNNE